VRGHEQAAGQRDDEDQLQSSRGAGRGPVRVGDRAGEPRVRAELRHPVRVTTVDYNHYSLLRTIEDLFDLAHLGYAAEPDLHAFGPDVFNR